MPNSDIQPAPAKARMVDAGGFVTPEWLRWQAQVRLTANSNGGDYSAAIAALQNRATTDEANILANATAITNLPTVAHTGSYNDLSNKPALGTAAFAATTAFDAAGAAASAVAGLAAFGPSGASHAKGLVPDPGATAGITKYLREDGTWSTPAGGGGGSGSFTVDVNGTVVATVTSGALTIDVNGTVVATYS